MNPITPWLDPEEVGRLAQSLLSRPTRPASQNAQEAGFGAGFEGYLGESQQPARQAPPPDPPPNLPPAPEPVPHPFQAPSPVAVPEPPPVAAAPPAAVPVMAEPEGQGKGPFLDRIRRFRDWLREHFQASGVFILDREGFVIFDESGHGKLHFLARSLAMTARRPSNPSANVHVKIGAGSTLEVIPVETPYGWFVLGAVVPEPMPAANIAVITEALMRVAAPPSTGN